MIISTSAINKFLHLKIFHDDNILLCSTLQCARWPHFSLLSSLPIACWWFQQMTDLKSGEKYEAEKHHVLRVLRDSQFTRSQPRRAEPPSGIFSSDEEYHDGETMVQRDCAFALPCGKSLLSFFLSTCHCWLILSIYCISPTAYLKIMGMLCSWCRLFFLLGW